MLNSDFIEQFIAEEKLAVQTRPFVNHAIKFKKYYAPEMRVQMLEECGFNVFDYPASMVTGCDLLSDSGTMAMTNNQWAALHYGDEAYGRNSGYDILTEKIAKIFGIDWIDYLYHQCRPAERAFFGLLSQKNSNNATMVIPSNGHFDTTRANIEQSSICAKDFFSIDLKDKYSTCHFKGNMNIWALRQFLQANYLRVPLVYLTITNNTGAGQPVSMKNICDTAMIAHEYDLPFFLDACRFAKNAWYIKQYESAYKEISLEQIILRMFSYADGFTISFKKDGFSNVGGGLFIKKGGLFEKKYPEMINELRNYQISTESHYSQGGMSGRDMMALSEGLESAINEKRIGYCVEQVRLLGEAMVKKGLPVVTPIGGHAVYLDVDKFFKGTSMKPEDFGGISITSMLLGLYGHRACELGNFAFGKYDKKTKKDIFPKINYVRFAVPYFRYDKQDLDSVAESVHALYKRRKKIPGVRVVYGRDLPARHFHAKFVLK